MKLGPNFVLPVEAVAQSFGLLAMRGAGKSNAAVVMAEEMFAARIPWVAVDPKGDWWGIRSSRSGKGPGLSIPVFGGLHGDIPLHPDGGKLLADLIVDIRLTCVVDVSEFSKGEQTRFLVDFADRLFRRQRKTPEPMHLFLEEAHEYLPQRVMRDQAVLVGLWSRIVKQGRSFGLGCTVISQRSASLNKDVLTQIGTLMVLRTLSPQDRKAIKDWVEEYDVDKTMLSSLTALEDGEAWIWSPQFLKVFKRIRFRQRNTFDSGATPKLGEVRTPKTLADIDLSAIETQWAESIERAKEEDPRELRRRVKELERQLANVTPETKIETREITREVLPDHLREGVLSLLDMSKELSVTADSIYQEAKGLEFKTGTGFELRQKEEPPRVTLKSEVAASSPVRPAATAPRSASEPSDSSLPAMEKKLLSVLVQHGGCSQAKLLVLAGYKVGGSYYRAMKALRGRGYISSGSPITATPDGVSALGSYTPLPTGPALFEFWVNQADGMGGVLLNCLRNNPKGLSQDDLLSCSGYKVGGSYYRAMKKLRNAGLVTSGSPIRLTDEFARAIE